MCYLIAPRDGITSLGQARRDGRDGAVTFRRYPTHVVISEDVPVAGSAARPSVRKVVVVPVAVDDVGVGAEGVPEGVPRFAQVVLGEVGNHGGQFRLVVREVRVFTVPDYRCRRRLLVNFGQMLLGNVVFQCQ